MKPRTVRAAILILVQHNLLWHSQSEEEGEVFEINIDECLMRLRYGRYVWLAEQLYGKSVRGYAFAHQDMSHRPCRVGRLYN